MRLISTGLLILLFSFYTNYSTAQTVPEKLDSLKLALSSSKPDTNKVLLLCEISVNYFQADPEQGVVYGKKALELAEMLNYDYGIIKAHNVIARCYAIRNNYPEALRHFQAALAAAEQLKSPRMVAILSVSLGALYSEKDEYDKALEYLMKAKEAYEEAGIVNNISLYTNIGYLYFKQKNYSEALTWYLDGIEIGEKNQANTDEIVTLYSNAGGMYIGLENYVMALQYLYTALAQQQVNGNLKSAAVTMNSIADAYLGIVKNEPAILPDSLRANQRNLDMAKQYIGQSHALSRELGLKDLVMEVYSNYADYYELKGNYKDAYIYYQNYTLLKDSLRDIDEEKKFAKIEAEFLFRNRTDSLKYLNALKDKKLQQRKYERNGFFLLAALITCLSLFFINRLKLRRKIAEETAMRGREQAQLQIDNLTRNIHEKNELIERFSEKLALKQSIGEQMPAEYDILNELRQAILLTDEQWADFKNNFEKIHKGYIPRLLGKIPDITPAETRFFVLSKLRLSNKEMANMLGISTQAIRVMKHRIMRKLGIEDDKILDEMIQSI